MYRMAFHISPAAKRELLANDKDGLLSAVAHCLPKRGHWGDFIGSHHLRVFQAVFEFIELETEEKPETFADFWPVLQLIDTALAADVNGQWFYTGDVDDEWIMEQLLISVDTLLYRFGTKDDALLDYLCPIRQLALMCNAWR